MIFRGVYYCQSFKATLAYTVREFALVVDWSRHCIVHMTFDPGTSVFLARHASSLAYNKQEERIETLVDNVK